MTQQQDSLSTLEETLEYTFADRSLLETALTHTSFVKGDGKRHTHNERLEFLGERGVLELCVSEHLYLEHPELHEGRDDAPPRAACLRTRALLARRRRLAFPAYLRLARRRAHGWRKQAIHRVGRAGGDHRRNLFSMAGISNAKRVIWSGSFACWKKRA
jgi:ribonuclease-3